MTHEMSLNSESKKKKDKKKMSREYQSKWKADRLQHLTKVLNSASRVSLSIPKIEQVAATRKHQDSDRSLQAESAKTQDQVAKES